MRKKLNFNSVLYPRLVYVPVNNLLVFCLVIANLNQRQQAIEYHVSFRLTFEKSVKHFRENLCVN